MKKTSEHFCFAKKNSRLGQAGDDGVEGPLIRRNLLSMAIVGGIVGIIGLILIYTVGKGMI